jgi:hypothetical protein
VHKRSPSVCCFPDNFGQAPDTFQDGEIGKLQSIVPGPGPSGEENKSQVVGDHPNLPRDPDKFDNDADAQREFRERGVLSGLTNDIYLDVYERLASFEPQGAKSSQRLFDAYAAEVRRVSGNDDGIITPRKATSTPRRTASRIMNGCSSRQRCSTASR